VKGRRGEWRGKERKREGGRRKGRKKKGEGKGKGKEKERRRHPQHEVVDLPLLKAENRNGLCGEEQQHFMPTSWRTWGTL